MDAFGWMQVSWRGLADERIHRAEHIYSYQNELFSKHIRIRTQT